MSDNKSKRGFASMPLEKRLEANRKGGLTASKRRTSHRWSREEAKEASKKAVRKTSKFEKLTKRKTITLPESNTA